MPAPAPPCCMGSGEPCHGTHVQHREGEGRGGRHDGFRRSTTAALRYNILIKKEKKKKKIRRYYSREVNPFLPQATK